MPTATTAAARALIASAASARDLAALGVHAVLADIVRADRQERAGADVQRDQHARPMPAAVERVEQAPA